MYNQQPCKVAAPCKAVSFVILQQNRAIRQGFTLAKHERLKSRKLLEQLFRQAPTFFVYPYKVYYQQDAGAQAEPLQAAFGVSARTFKKAADRNRIKRLTREVYRLQKNPLQQKLASTGKKLAVFFLYTGKEVPEFDIVKEKMQAILAQLENKLPAQREQIDK